MADLITLLLIYGVALATIASAILGAGLAVGRRRQERERPEQVSAVGLSSAAELQRPAA